MIWDTDAVEARLADAASTLKALPSGDGRYLYNSVPLWPDMQALPAR